MDKKRILIVDDEPDMVKFVQIRLEANGYEVLAASDGEEALTVVKKELPDLIILDIVMPKIDGLKVCETLKKDPAFAKTPIIILTAKDQQQDIDLAKQAGADGYVAKPFEAHLLLYDISELLKKKDAG